MESQDAEEFKDTWIPENVSEANREFITSTLGFE